MRSLHFVWGLRTGNRFVRNFFTCSTARIDSKSIEDINLGLVYQGNCNCCISRLQECAKKQCLTKGRHVHAQIIRNRIGPQKLLWNALINMYIKCRTITDACLLFNSMFNQDVFTWTIMITGHAEVGDCNQVFALFEQMQQYGMAPNKVTYVSILCACARANALEQGKCIHAFIIKSITYLDIFVENALINMYAKCGSIYDASQLFTKMLDPDMVSWNAVISGYVQDGDGEKARNMFVQMREIGLQPSKITYLTMLSSCTNQGWGKLLHALLLKNEVKLEVFLGTALLAMYVKYGNIVDAWQVFDRIPEKNAVSWTVMISSYTEYGNKSQALTLFEEMQYYFTPNRVTYINMLNACGSAVEFVKILHSHLLKFNIQLDMFIENKLLDIYIKCGNSEVAQQIFDRLQERDVVSWTSMVSGYAENQNGFGALKLFLELLHSGLEPNQATFVSVLCGCSCATALQWGRFIHAYVIRAGLNSEIFVSNSNIAMYIACGSIDDAWQIFKLMPSPDVVSCTAMLSGLVQFGDAFRT